MEIPVGVRQSDGLKSLPCWYDSHLMFPGYRRFIKGWTKIPTNVLQLTGSGGYLVGAGRGCSFVEKSWTSP